jgi:tetratricopeptide (TPR) repeat protein
LKEFAMPEPSPPRRGAAGRDPGRGGTSGRDDGPRSRGAENSGGKLDVPAGAKEPIGRDRAKRRGDAPPRQARTAVAPPRPALPTDEQPLLPRAVEKEIDRTLGKGSKANDIALALSIGSAAIDEGRADVALEVLAWAKHEAPRIVAVREAYGVALYLGEQYAAALTELQAYRRITGRVDQNHLVADCLRALGRDLDQIAAAAETLINDEQAPEDRRAEAVIVWAAALADDGDVNGARAILRRFLERPRSGDAEHDLRARYLAADLAEQADDPTDARRQLELIHAVDPSFLDIGQRLQTDHDTSG